ncbi:MAG TPA: YcnI family protein [Acidimicrobiales bacterium]|nr:YcnI family protein [Acidimicrobiales bacterium]
MSHRLKLFGAAGLIAALVVAMAAPAFAHVTTDPDSAPQGGEITLVFRVPNEEASANTIQFEVDIPTDHPLLGIDVEPLPGWTAKVSQVNLNPPVQTDDGPVNQAVNQIIWTATAGGGIAPGQFQEFRVLVQTLPKNANQVVFKALQTYSDGNIVRWIDPVTAGQPAPDHPTPILILTAAASDGSTPTTAPAKSTGSSTQAAVDVSKLAKQSSVDSARTVGVIGLLVGALGLIVAVIAIATRPRPPAGRD